MSFRYSNLVLKVLGEGGTKAVAKVSSLLLTAIAVMMIRSGITTFFQ
jgi:small neutral amino acid transporter SnatA (MarC family)